MPSTIIEKKNTKKIECAVDGMPLQIPTHVAYATDSMADRQMDLLSHTFTMIENPVASLVKFYPATLEKIALWTEGWMEGKITLLLHTLTMGGAGFM